MPAHEAVNDSTGLCRCMLPDEVMDAIEAKDDRGEMFGSLDYLRTADADRNGRQGFSSIRRNKPGAFAF
jgi:hypothetical protein